MTKVINSKDKIDQRLIDLLRVQQASMQGYKIKFRGLNFEDHDKKNEETQQLPTLSPSSSLNNKCYKHREEQKVVQNENN